MLHKQPQIQPSENYLRLEVFVLSHLESLPKNIGLQEKKQKTKKQYKINQLMAVFKVKLKKISRILVGIGTLTKYKKK